MLQAKDMKRGNNNAPVCIALGVAVWLCCRHGQGGKSVGWPVMSRKMHSTANVEQTMQGIMIDNILELLILPNKHIYLNTQNTTLTQK